MIRELDKMELNKYICSMDDVVFKNVFANIKKEIDDLRNIFIENN